MVGLFTTAPTSSKRKGACRLFQYAPVTAMRIPTMASQRWADGGAGRFDRVLAGAMEVIGESVSVLR
jgi:hypothetical protein